MIVAALAALSLFHSSLPQGQFETRANFFVSGTPVPLSVVVGDFSGDGVIDLAVVNSLSSSGSVTFSPTQKGAKQGTITIIDSASTKPQVIEVLGTGT